MVAKGDSKSTHVRFKPSDEVQRHACKALQAANGSLAKPDELLATLLLDLQAVIEAKQETVASAKMRDAAESIDAEGSARM